MEAEEQRPLCECHGEPMSKHGKKANGEIKWDCAVKNRAAAKRDYEKNRDERLAKDREQYWSDPEKSRAQMRDRYSKSQSTPEAIAAREAKRIEREAEKELKMLTTRKTPKEWRDPEAALFDEFSKIVYKQIHRWYKGELNRTDKCSHLDFEDLHQTGMMAIWERRDEFDDLTDRDERGMLAMKIAGNAISKMVTRNRFIRADKKANISILPIVPMTELGFDDGDAFSSLDLAADPVEDYAPSADLRVAFEQLKPRSQRTITMLRCGYSFPEIAEGLGIGPEAVKDDLYRDLNRHGLLAEWTDSHEMPMSARRLREPKPDSMSWHENRDCPKHGYTSFYCRPNARGYGLKFNCLRCEAERKSVKQVASGT